MTHAITKILNPVLIPLLAPLVAAIALVIGLRSEIRKLRAQRDHDRQQRAESVFTEVFYATALSDVIAAEYGLGKPSPDRLEEVRKSFERIMDKLMAEPGIGARFRHDVKFVDKSKQKAKMFLMLGEARRQIALPAPGKRDFLWVYLALLTLTYLYETKAERRDSDSYEAIDLICRSEPDLGPFLIDKATPSLRIISTEQRPSVWQLLRARLTWRSD